MNRGGNLPRRARLARSPWPRRAPVLGGPGARRPPRGLTAATRSLIYARDRKRCVRCGVWIPTAPQGGSVQHRRARAAGGTSLAWVNRAANGVIACGSGTTACHGYIEAHRDVADRLGWRISPNAALTAVASPVLYAALGEVRLLNDGGTFQVLAQVGDVEHDETFDVAAWLPTA